MVIERSTPAASIVVCSYNGGSTLRACLDSLEQQTIRDRVEIIVVDDGSDDDTADVAGTFHVELIRHPRNLGLSAARNTGIRAARGPIIAFIDDDCIANRDWIAELLAPYQRDEIAAVGGLVSIARIETFVHRYLADNNPLAPLELELAESGSLPYRFALYLRRMWSSADERPARAVYSFPGANMSFRKEVLDAVGLLDDHFTFGSEDENLCAHVRDHFPNMLLWFETRAEVRHDYVGTLHDVARRNYLYGLGHARFYLMQRAQKWPTVFPAPVLAILCLALWRRPRQLLAALLLIQIALPQGILGASRHRRLVNLAFSYIRFLEETAHDAGIVIGLVQELSRRMPPPPAERLQCE